MCVFIPSELDVGSYPIHITTPVVVATLYTVLMAISRVYVYINAISCWLFPAQHIPRLLPILAACSSFGRCTPVVATILSLSCIVNIPYGPDNDSWIYRAE